MDALSGSKWGGVMLAATLLLGATPAAATPTEAIKSLKSFVNCLNTKIGEGNPSDISKSLQCLPSGCTMTLTMSDESAQPACSLGAGDGVTRKCQLPRVILNCPGPPPFIPSYVLCPGEDNSNTNTNRVEIAAEVTRRERINLVMGDIDLPPGIYAKLLPWSVISRVKDTKGCNACHDNGNPTATSGAQQSFAIDTFGTSHLGTALAPFIIDTNEPGRVVKPGAGLTAQSLAEVCACIEEAVHDDLHPLFGNVLVRDLCQGLLTYRQTRGWR